MRCPDCECGEFDGATCFRCDGSGEVCDLCGEAMSDPCRNLCQDCEMESERELDTN